MKRMLLCIGSIIFLVSHVCYAPATKYVSKTSTVKAGGKSKVKAKKKMVVSKGTLGVGKNATLEGNDYTFETSTFDREGGSQITTSATFNANNQTLAVNANTLRIDSGAIQQSVTVGGNAQLEGFTTDFEEGFEIELEDEGAVLSVAMTSPLSLNIVLNNGTVSAAGDLTLGHGASFQGNGNVEFNGNTIAFDATERTFSNNLEFVSAADLEFNGKIILGVDATWTFSNDGFLSGNGNILDISSGATIRIRRNTTLYMSNLKLRGLGVGQIAFDDPSSQLRLSSVEFEMHGNYTVTTGGIYAEGPTTIVTKDHLLTFDQAGSLTVSGIALTYDTLDFADQSNIRPEAADDPNAVNLTLTYDGIIRRVFAEQIGDSHYGSNRTLDGLLLVHPGRRIFFDDSVTLDGQTHLLIFTKASEPLVLVAAGKTVTIQNATLGFFSPSFVSLGSDSNLIFGDATSIDFARNEELNTTWTFRGNCIVNGENHILTLGSLGNIIVDTHGASLLLENMTIKGASGNKIRCMDDTCTISFKNVKFIQDGNYSFSTGRFEVLDLFDVNGTYTFTYQSAKQSKITSGATMKFDRAITFSYAPRIADRDLLAMEDASAALVMVGATLASTTTGMRLTKGILLVDHKNYLANPGAASASQAIAFGNGVPADDLTIRVLPGGSINMLSGRLVYDNAS